MKTPGRQDHFLPLQTRALELPLQGGYVGARAKGDVCILCQAPPLGEVSGRLCHLCLGVFIPPV